MTPSEFRKMALALPEVVEAAHMKHPDFRVGGKIFATLGAPGLEWGMVRLSLDDQELFLSIDPEGFQPAAGAWGRQGCTNVRLDAANKTAVRDALAAAWKHRISTPAKARPARRRPRR